MVRLKLVASECKMGQVGLHVCLRGLVGVTGGNLLMSNIATQPQRQCWADGPDVIYDLVTN